MRQVIVLFMATGMVAGILTGCNTMQGLGKDIKAGGAKIEQSARQ